MRLLIVICCVLALLSCKKEERTFDNLNGGRVDVIGHGGGGIQNLNNPFPWNTIKSISSGLADDADAIEIDIRLSADSTLILFHDGQLNFATDCDGCVSALDAGTLVECTYRQGLLASLSGEKVISLAQCLDFLVSAGVNPTIYLDVHFGDECSVAGSSDNTIGKITENITDALNAHQTLDDMRVLCLDRQFLSVVELAEPQILTYWEVGMSDENILLSNQEGFHGMVNKLDDASASRIKSAHDAGQHVILFGPFDQWSHNEALDMHPDGVISDNVALMRNMLD